MPARGEYFDGCPSAHALDLIGDRWALLVVRELLLGPKRFTDLIRGVRRISRNVLSQRLDDLQSAGVLTQETLPPPAASAVYRLTNWGLQLESVLQAIGRWGAQSPSLPVSDSVGIDTFVLGLRAQFSPAAAQDLTARYELRVNQETFDFRIHDGQLRIRRGSSEEPDLVINVDPAAMAPVARGDLPLATALSPSGPGSDSAIAQFAGCFHQPRFSAASATAHGTQHARSVELVTGPAGNSLAKGDQ